jgi:hypothetical protein
MRGIRIMAGMEAACSSAGLIMGGAGLTISAMAGMARTGFTGARGAISTMADGPAAAVMAGRVMAAGVFPTIETVFSAGAALFAGHKFQFSATLVRGDATFDCGKDFHGKKAPRKNFRAIPRDRAQIVAGPDEAVELASDDPGWRIIKFQALLGGGQFDGVRVGRARMRDWGDIDLGVTILIRECDHDCAWPVLPPFLRARIVLAVP